MGRRTSLFPYSMLAAASGIARHGRVLEIPVRSGDTVRFADDSTEGDDYQSFAYRGRLAGTPFHLLQVGHYEGRTWMLVHDSTGRRIAIDGSPVAAPGGAVIAAASFDLVAGFDFNGVEIFEVAADSLRSVWRLEPPEWGPDSLHWASPDTLRLIQQWRDSTPDSYRPQAATVTRTASGWALAPTTPPPA
ncbi:MAG: hypothetical protein R2882_07485 [Gemmatimonadales bacterium]